MLRTYQQRVKKILPGGVHYNFHTPWEDAPLHYIKTKDSRVWDMDSKEYLDLYARFGATILGHGNQEYSQSLKDTIDRVLCVSHCDFDAEALEIIAKHVPSAEMIRLGVSGTEIVQVAIRLARAWTGKNRFIRFEGHFHGNADNIMGGKALSRENPVPIDFKEDMKWTDGRAQKILETQSYLIPWNDIAVLEDLLIRKSDEIAAIITEPVCVSSGSIMPTPGYLQKMRELCDKYHVVLIFDEIVTGVRMGLGGAQTYFDVIPDLTTLGKAIAGGGVPIGVLAGKKEIMQLMSDKRVIHAGTFNGYPLGTAAIKTTFEILEKDNQSALANMNEKILQIHAILKNRADAIGLPMVIQGPPGCASYHCTSQILKKPSDYNHEIASLDIILNTNLAKNGILVSVNSRLFPNIALSLEDVTWFHERVDQALLATKQIYEEFYMNEPSLV